MLIKRLGPINGFELNCWMSLMTAPQLLLGSLLFEPGAVDAVATAGWQAYAAIFYMAVLVTIVGYGLWYFLIPRYDVNQTMPFTLLVPIIAVVAGAVILDEPVTLQVVIGGAATIAGVAIVIIRRPRVIAPEAQAEQ